MRIINMNLIAIIIILILIFVPTNTYAFSNIIKDGDEFLKYEEQSDTIIKRDELNKTSDYIYKILLIISIIVAVGTGAFLGIQLMMQGAAGKAQIKEALMPYVVGCMIVFGGFGIWKLIVIMARNL